LLFWLFFLLLPVSLLLCTGKVFAQKPKNPIVEEEEEETEITTMSSLYQDYKISTEQFQKWILKTSALTSLPKGLNYLRVHVQNIVRNGPTLTKQTNFSKELTTVLYHGKAAIKARTTVHLTKVNEIPEAVSSEEYQTYLESNRKHAHCIQLLQECWEKLNCLAPDILNSDNSTKKSLQKEVNLSAEVLAKQFSSLEVQDLPDEQTGLALPADEEIIDLDTLDIQYGEIRLRLICFFIEMTQLEEYLVHTWKRVQNLEISIPAAAVVTLSAIQKVKIIDSELALTNPSISNAVGFFAGLKQFLSPMEMANIAEHPTYQLLSLIMEFYTSYGGSISTARCPFSRRPVMVRQRGCCNEGEVYNECDMPQLGSDRTSVMWFLDTEMCVLYNSLVIMKQNCDSYESFLEHFHTRPGHLTIAGYIREFIDFFDTQNQSTTLLFMSLCWIRSVQCMVDSDRLTLSKSIYLYRSFIRQRNINFQVHSETFEHLQKLYETNSLFTSISELRNGFNDDTQWIYALESWTVHHNHPLLVGGYFLDTVFADHSSCFTLMKKVSQFYKFVPWFYFALKETMFFTEDEIPFLEKYAKLVERSYSFKKAPKDPVSPEYVNYLCKAFTENGYSAPFNKGTIPISIEKMLLAPKDVSSLYSIISLDDFSALTAESIHSIEGFDELISITERELLESGYLSVDLFKYLISFNSFILYLHGKQKDAEPDQKTNPVKEWYDKDYPKCRRSIFQWTRDVFFPFVAKQLKSPVAERTHQDSTILNYFAQIMKTFFNDQMKDAEEYQEKTFIFHPQVTTTWRAIYVSRFSDSYTVGMNQIMRCVGSLPPKALEEYDWFIGIFKRWSLSSIQSRSLSKLQIIAITKKFVYDHVISIVASEKSGPESAFLKMTLSDPVIHDQELAEYVFVTFGCFLYLSDENILNHALFDVCNQGNIWSLDLLMSVTSLVSMIVQESRTGDTVFHKLAKKNQLTLLEYIMNFGYVPALIDITGKRAPEMYNNEGKQFTYYIRDSNIRRTFEHSYIDYFDTRLKHVAAQRRETGELNPPPMTRYLDRFRSQERDLASYLQEEAREETVEEVKRQFKKGKRGKKVQAIIQIVTKEDEEKAKQAEEELLAMLDREKNQPTTGKKKSKKKSAK
jgi:hypothetical protein